MSTSRRIAIMTGLAICVLSLGVVWVQGGDVQTKTFNVKKGASLYVQVDNASADIKIRVSEKKEVTVRVDGISEDELEDLVMTQEGNTVRVEFLGGGRRWSRAGYLRFMINVPSEINLDLSTSGGDIAVDDKIKGEIRAATSGGDIDINDAEGEVDLRTSGGDVFAGHVVGDASLRTSGGDIEVRNVEGDLEAATAGGDISGGDVQKDLRVSTAGGDITMGNVGGKASASTAGGDIELERVGGDADLKTAGGDIELAAASGEVEAKTAGGDISLREVKGFVHAATAGGDIYTELDPSGEATSDIETKGGDIELVIPSDAKVTIQARIRIRGGWHEDEDEYDIYSDFKPDSEERTKKEIRARYVLNGGGKLVSLETMNGNIGIKKKQR